MHDARLRFPLKARFRDQGPYPRVDLVSQIVVADTSKFANMFFTCRRPSPPLKGTITNGPPFRWRIL